ncbi:MAG: hypothetical protein Q7V88_11875 [Actinomycetota bacterium]|nr:hypothetical protein [Actinomycetota bacterium]
MAHDSVPDGAHHQVQPVEPAGLLPPDGVAWPPEPAPVAAAPQAPNTLPPTTLPPAARRPADAHIDDWRSMPTIVPEGYHGSAGAPPVPPPTFDSWSIAAFVCALAGMLPWLLPYPLLPCMAIGLGLAGRRACTLNETLRGKALATAAVVLGAATLLLVLSGVATNRLTLFG